TYPGRAAAAREARVLSGRLRLPLDRWACALPRGRATSRHVRVGRVNPMRRTLFEDLHEDFRASFRTFLQREVVGEEGRFGQWERDGLIPREVFARAGSGGFLGMAVPEQYGGAGAEDFRLNLVIGEECQRAGVGGFGLGITLHNDICLPY